MNMFTMTQALQNALTNPLLTDNATQKAGPAFGDLDRMEDFWDVSKNGGILHFLIYFSWIVHVPNSCPEYVLGNLVQ